MYYIIEVLVIQCQIIHFLAKLEEISIKTSRYESYEKCLGNIGLYLQEYNDKHKKMKSSFLKV
jgi:hypothetical protein